MAMFCAKRAEGSLVHKGWKKGSEVMSWNLLTRSIYGAESRLELVLSAPRSRELRRSVTCTSTREIRSQRVLSTQSDSTTCTSTCTSGHPKATAYCHHGRPIQGSQTTICTNHSLFTHHRLLSRGMSPGHMAMTSMHNNITSPSPVSITTKVSYGTRFIMSSSIVTPPCRQFSAIVSSMCRAKKGGWFCQHMSSLCQQRRTYAKKAKKSMQKLNEDDQDIIDLEKVESSMEAAINALKHDYTNSIITRITPATFDKMTVKIDGESYQLKAVGQLGMPNPQTIVINMAAYPQAVNSVVAALRDADLNLNPIPEKNIIKVPLPKMTKELRASLVKVAKTSAEKCKLGVRKARQKAMADLKKTDASKDSIKRLEKHIQELTDRYTDKIEEMFKAKTAELLKGN